MKLRLERKALKETYTIGKLYIDGVYFCDTLEDSVRDLNKNGKFDNGEVKIPGKTAIPYGTYKIIYNMSPRFKRMLPRLLGVPHFDGVLIHSGNTDADTEGCILVGVNSEVGKIVQSRVHSDKLNALIEKAHNNKEPITIEIV